ncbi:hypothetical protein NPIL_653751, partial [Nephila pilipes]
MFIRQSKDSKWFLKNHANMKEVSEVKASISLIHAIYIYCFYRVIPWHQIVFKCYEKGCFFCSKK